jgi:MYXO-CTERM domain-containing protein
MRRSKLRLALASLLAITAALSPVAARATYSIVGTDSATRQVGGAGTSCVGGNISVYIIYASAPGFGVVASQANADTNGRDDAADMLRQGMAPETILQTITSNVSSPSSRQYGVVDLMGRAAGYTGSSNGNYADDRQGSVGTFTYSTQGNILTSGAVLDNTSATFESQGCDLADKLMLALEAGAEDGEGDSRCTPRGIPSDGAFIQVDEAGGSTQNPYLRIRIDNTRTQNPVSMLRAEFDQWRETHPCSTGTGGTGGSGGAGSGGASGSGGAGGSGGTGAAGGAAGSGGGANGSGGSTGGASGSGGGGAGGVTGGGAGTAGSGAAASGGSRARPDTTESDSGCSCRTTGGGRVPNTLFFLAAVSALFLRRSRARRSA